MNLRAYLTLLRPVRTLLLGLFNSWGFGLFLLRHLGGCTQAEALAITTVIVAPLIFGDLMAGPVHEFMNRSAFPMLPGARRQLRRRHLQGLLVPAGLLVTSAGLFAPRFPITASIGLVALCLSLPLLNSRRSSWAFLVLLLLIAPFLSAAPREALIGASQSVPWAFLGGGICCAFLCIRHIFSAKLANECWKSSYVVATQTLAPFYDTTMIQRRREDNERRAVAKGKRPAREWLVGAVGASWRDWAHVIRYARLGGASWIWGTTGTIAFCGFPALVYIAIPIGFGILTGKPHQSLPELGRQLLAGANGTGETGMVGRLAFQSLPYTSIMVTLFALAASAVPTTRFPLSRRRLADCIFAENLRIGAMGCLGFVLATITPIAIAALLTHTPIEVALFSRMLKHALILPTVILLGIAIIHAVVRYGWMASFGGYLLWAAVGGALGGFAMAITESRLGAFLWLPGLVLSAWLARTSIRSYYATHDLNRLMPWAARFFGRTA